MVIIRMSVESSVVLGLFGLIIDPSGVSLRYPIYGAPRDSSGRYDLSNDNGRDWLTFVQSNGIAKREGSRLYMAYRWETPASVWQEDERSGQFELLATEGLGRIDWQAQAHGRLPDVARLLGASLPGACACAPIYPEGFAFCPTCGRPLQRLPGTPSRLAGWWGPGQDAMLPRHVPHGLPVTSLPLGDSLEERPAAPHVGRADLSMPAPPNSTCVFAAAHYGFPEQRLLALAYTRGVLQYWDPVAQLWHVMTPDEGAASLAFTASDYAWLPVPEPRRGEVALVPTPGGLMRLWINPVS